MADGPVLLIQWCDRKPGAVVIQSRYYPGTGVTQKAAEDFCFDWFCSRRARVLDMTWAWGEIPVEASPRKVDL
jgi:hypothetical protein